MGRLNWADLKPTQLIKVAVRFAVRFATFGHPQGEPLQVCLAPTWNRLGQIILLALIHRRWWIYTAQKNRL